MKSNKKRMQSIITAACCACMMLSSTGCDLEKTPDLPEYKQQDFVLFGFWAPYELTEESFTLYKQSGLNTMLFVNHSVPSWTSETLHYLGSEATQRSLELCRKVGLNALPNYGDWYRSRVEGKSFGSTPFSTYDLYGEYKDIIVGMHIADEPSIGGIPIYGKDSLTADYKSVYDVPYMVNLFPSYADAVRIGGDGYRNYVQTYADEVVADFENNRLLSVDFYPFRTNNMLPDWLTCYNDIANVAKATNSKQSYYIQTAIGNEFQDSLGLDEIRMQVNVAMAFGADWFGFYCYETPRTYTGDEYEPMYKYCMLKPDGTPSPLYYAVQSELARISAFSNAYLSYDWEKLVSVYGEENSGMNIAFRLMGEADFTDTAIKSVTASHDTIVGCFDSEYGEAFMLVNYENPVLQQSSSVEMEFTKGEYAAVYGKDQAPQIIKLEKGKLQLELGVSEGLFVTLFL